MPTQQTDVVRYLPAGQSHFRDGSATKDTNYINCFRESVSNPTNNSSVGYTIKRDGLSLLADITSASEARGCFYWDKTGLIYSAFDNKVYRCTTTGTDVAEVLTLSTITGKVGFLDFVGVGVSYLIITDGIKLYTVTTSHTVDTIYIDQVMRITVTNGGTGYTTPPTVTFTGGGGTGAAATAVISGGAVISVAITNRGAGYTSAPTIGFTGGGGSSAAAVAELVGMPSPHIPTPVFMNEYVFLLEAGTNRIWNCDVGNPVLWTGTNYLTAEIYGDSGVALTRQINQIVSLNTESTEYFYDAQNLLGSPLGKTDQGVQRYGCLSAKSVATQEDFSAFVGTGATGHAGVYVLKDYQIVKISHETIDRIIKTETSPADITGAFIRMKGHLFYMIRMPNAGRTFAYDMYEKAWCEWNSWSGGSTTNFGLSYLAATPEFVFGQYGATGNLYKFDPNVYQDASDPIYFSYRTNPFDMDNRYNKRCTRLEVLGDKQTTTCAATLYYTDNDYVTWRGGWSIDLSNDRAYVANCGTFRRRALRVDSTANTPIRLSGFEIAYTQGDH